MSNIQVPAEQRRNIEEAHRQWTNGLPQKPGQIGKTISTLVIGPPIYAAGEIAAHPDFAQIRFSGLDPRFLAFLNEQDIPFQEN